MSGYTENSFEKKAKRGKKNLKLMGKLAATIGTGGYAAHKSSQSTNQPSNTNTNVSIAGCLIGLLFVIIGFVLAFACTDTFMDGAICVIGLSALGLLLFWLMSKSTNEKEHTQANEEVAIKDIPYHPEQIGDENARFALVQEGKRTLFVVGLNPSTADSEKPDPTMQSVLRIASYNGFDGFIMLNLYPLRATQPYNLPKELDKDLHKKNLQLIDELLKGRENVEVWLAFGANAGRREYFKPCFEDIVKTFEPYNPKWYYINNLTKEGYPPHPLYQSVDYFKEYPMK